ncbi:MAG: glutamate racemase [Deltaproteobacteria bacterium]|nr:glutamate racemase [Deltaproteobacteria bacterium]
MSEHDGIIGVFDSGLGGLTVLRAIVEQLPGEATVYLGDTARVPYGTKSAAVVTRYALRIAEHLLQYPLKALVVACNTASAVALPALREQLSIPVLGVVEPGAQAAIAASVGQRIAVLATEGTVRSRAYERTLLRLVPDAHVVGRACPLFVPLVEEGLLDGPIVELACRRYLEGLAREIDTAILGCTHYPLIAGPIGQVLGAGVRLVDSAFATARALADLLVERNAISVCEDPGKSLPRDLPERRFLFTDANERTAELCSRFFGEPIRHFEAVDL